MTGISRKEVSRMRRPTADGKRWTPNMETSPVNTILHGWHFDPDFSDGAGTAHALPFEGPLSFSALVSRYAHDIPPGAVLSTLQKTGVVYENDRGLLAVTQSFFYSRKFDEDFVRGLAFSMSNLGSTLVYNAALHKRAELSIEQKSELSRLERGVFSEHLTPEGITKFKKWVDIAAPRFLEEANHLIGETELPKIARESQPPRTVGVGIFYYEED